MKRFLMFLGLKVLEVSGVVFLPWLIGKLYFHKLFPEIGKPIFISIWFSGIGGVACLVFALCMLFAICMVILKWINWNWKLTHKGEEIEWIRSII